MRTRECWKRIRAGCIACLIIPGGLLLATGMVTYTVATSEDKPTFPATATCRNVEELEVFFRTEQHFWNQIAPPDENFTLCQGGDLIEFDPDQFPAEFVKGLIETTEFGCPVYPIIIAEDPVTRDTIFANADGKEIYAMPPAKDYDPYQPVEKWVVLIFMQNYAAAKMGRKTV